MRWLKNYNGLFLYKLIYPPVGFLPALCIKRPFQGMLFPKNRGGRPCVKWEVESHVGNFDGIGIRRIDECTGGF